MEKIDGWNVRNLSQTWHKSKAPNTCPIAPQKKKNIKVPSPLGYL